MNIKTHESDSAFQKAALIKAGLVAFCGLVLNELPAILAMIGLPNIIAISGFFLVNILFAYTKGIIRNYIGFGYTETAYATFLAIGYSGLGYILATAISGAIS